MVRSFSLGLVPGRGTSSGEQPPPAFHPASLFASGEEGGVWDFSDASAMSVGRDGSGGAPAYGDEVGRVSDAGPNGLALQALSDAARPVHVLGASGPGLSFDGAASFLQTAAGLAGPDLTILIAMRSPLSDHQTDGLVAISDSQGTSGTFFLVSDVAAGGFEARLRSTDMPDWPGGPGSVDGVFRLVLDAAAAEASLHVDGAERRTVSGYLGNVAGAPIILAANRQASSFLQCDIGAMIAINRVLSAAEMTEAEAWMSERLTA